MRDEPQQDTLSTTPPELPFETLRRARNVRRCGIVALGLVLALGMFGVLGVTDATASARAENIELQVRYARVARTGLTAPLSIVVRAAQGFATAPRVRISREYLDIFSTFEIDPRPLRSLSHGDGLIWEFAPPLGATLTIDAAARIDPSVQTGAGGEIALLEGERPLVRVPLKTTVLP